jgi:hypothetical protein
MKKLKVFKDLNTDVFFERAKTNSIDRFDAADRAKCLAWEYKRTLCSLFPDLLGIIEARKSLSEFIDKIDDKYSKESIWDNISNHTSDFLLLTYFENTRELIVKADLNNRLLSNMANKFPELIPGFPQKAYLQIKASERAKWECPIKELQYRNVTSRYPMHLFSNVEDLEDLLDENNQDSPINELVLSCIARAEPVNKAQKECREDLVVSSRVGIELFVDPNWSLGSLENILRENTECIHELAQVEKKKKAREGIKFSERNEIPEKRILKTVNANLNLLGYYRLLVCEKWSWSDVDTLFEEKFSSKGKASSVRPMTLEHYKRSVESNFPYLKHSDVIL